MCNLYTYKMTAAETRTLKLHYQFIGTTWTEALGLPKYKPGANWGTTSGR
jgi:hypothetical protein